MKNKIFILILSIMSIMHYAQCVPSATNPDSDGDGIADVCDYDDDNDGILDTVECPTVNNKPLFHLFDYTPSNLADPLWLYKQTNGIASAYVCASGTGCSTAPNGQPYANVNVTGTVDNLAYDDGKYYTINSAGNLLYSANIITGNFINLGNANIGSGYKNLGYDNGVFYHWKRIGSTNNIELFSTTNPVSVPWTSLGTIVGGTYTFGSGGFNYLLKDIAVNDGIFYFLYDGTDVPTDESYSSVRSIVYSNNSPTTAASSWQNLGSANFGVDVYNIAYGSEDVLTLCDTDDDGIPNHLDLDSDNDGCPDAIEGGASFTSANLVNSSMPGGNTGASSGTFNQPITQNLGNTVNTVSSSTRYGVPTIAVSGQTLGTSQTANPVLTAGTAGNNQTIATGSTPTALSLSGSTGSIQWQVSTDNTTFNNISGATNTSYAPGALTATRYYRATVTSAGGCTAISNTVTINVVPPYDCTGKIYSLSSVTGEIRVFNNPNSSGALGAVMNTTPHPTAISSAPNGPNALGYSNATRKFYYVLNQNNGSGNTFVSYDPITNIYQTLAGTTGYIYRGTVTNDGLGYYGLTSSNELKYYNIATNTWTSITDYYVDQNGNDLFTILNTYSGGDIAIDGNGDLWILAGTNSSPTTFLFRAKGPLPKTDLGAVPMVLEQIAQQNIGAGSSGIAFNSVGELFITNSANLYKMNNNFTISLIGNLSPSNGGGDLASCAFPLNPYSISDFGDAPDSYGTLLTSNGPRHTALQYNATNNTSTLMIGSTVDLENDGFPNGNSDGDDNNNLNDENSVTMPVLNSTATSYSVNVPLVNTTGATGTLRGWIDFNKNGVFEASEATSVSVPNGSTTATLSWTGLSGLSGGDTYYRLRIAKNNSDIAQPTGLASGGEVEDGKISISGPAVCYRDPINNGTGSETKMGITLLKRAGSNDPDNWPMVRKSGHIALESNTQGFVVTRMAKADLGNITNPQEGMMVYDTTDKCLKIYSDNAWKCFSTPACP
ncbi:GEVED domain-containing protein [Chryseobacterium aquaticum]|nr:GEVED domain-containing protein [Chryseobacterium aquaticum]